MNSLRTKFADLYAKHFMCQGFTQESCHNRVDIQDLVVGILIRPHSIRDQLPKPTTFLRYFACLDGAGPRLSHVLAWQKLGAWIASVGDKVQRDCWNTT